MSAPRPFPTVPPLYRGLVRRTLAAALVLSVAGVTVPFLGQDRPASLGAVERVAAADVPTGITVTAPTEGGRLSIRWNAVTGAEQYKVYVYTGTNAGTGATVASTSTSYTATGLTNGTTYNVVVSTVKMLLAVVPVESKSAVFTGTPADVAPGAPTIGTATVADRSSVVSWTSPGDGDITRFEVLDAGGTVVATATGAAATSVTVPGLVNGTSSAFRVRAVDGTGHTGAPSAAVAVTPRDALAPAAPTALTATAGDRSATLSWTAPADYDVARYDVLAADGSVVGTVPAGTTTLAVTGLVNGTAYTYRVRAVDTSANTGPTSAAAVVTPRDTVAPAAPTNLTATPADRSATLSWTAPADYDVARYEVLNAAGTVIATAPVGTTTATAPGLVNGTATTLRVRAVDTSANPGATASVTVTPRDSVAPAVPTGLLATPGDRLATLTWNAPADTDIARYEILDTAGTVLRQVPAGTTTTTWTGLVNGTPYTVSIRSVDTSGNVSPASPAVTTTPRDTVAPGMPRNFTASANDKGANFAWLSPGDYDVAGYSLYDGDGNEVKTAGPAATATFLSGLVNGRTYSYYLKARDTSGNLSVATPVRVVVPRDAVAPAAPRALTATVEDRRTTLSWTAPADTDLATYEVLDANGTVVTSVTSPTRTVVLSGLTNGVAYTWTVRAVDTSGNTGPASTSTTVTPRDAVAPGAPSTLTAVPGDRSAVLSWTAPADADVASYDVLREDGTVLVTVPSGTTTATVTGLVNGTGSTFRVRAVDTSRNSSVPSGPVTVVPRDAVAPGAPTGLAAVAGDRSAVLTWVAPTDTDLLRYEVVSAAGTVVATVPAGTTSATVTGLVNGTASTFTVRAVDTSSNVSVPSSPVTVVPRDAVAPGAPTGLAAVAGDRSAVLSWVAPTDTDLLRYEVVYAAGTVVATVPAGTTTATLTGLVNGTASTFTVRAVDTSGNTGPASAPTTVTPRDAVAPAAPINLTAVPGDRSAVLSWTAPADADVASYDVLRQDGTVLVTVPAGTTTATVTGLVNGTASTFRVRAVDTSANSSVPSNPVTVVPRDAVAPGAPTGLAAVAGDRSAVLSWVAPSDADLLRYEVVSAAGTVVATVPAGTTTATLTGLVNGTASTFTVRAVDTSANTGPASVPVTVTPADGLAPGAPTAVTATGADSSLTVSWTAPADADLAGYRVLAADGTVLATVPAGTTTVTLTGLPNGVPVTVTVTATDTSGNTSPPSGPATATPHDAVAPAAPAAVTATPGDGTATFAWTPPADTDVARYEVRTGDGTVLATFPAPASGGAVTGLVNGTAYDLVVVAVDTSQNSSAPSAVVRVTPQGAPGVTGLQAAPGDTVVALTWTAVPGATGYEVLQDDVVVATVTTTATTVTGLTNGQGYAFTVRAVVASGSRGPTSVAVTATPVRPVTTGTPVTGSGSAGFGVSRDGRFVVVATRERLEPSDTNTVAELYLLDQVTGAARRLAPQPAGATTSDPVQASAVSVSADGRYVALATSQRMVAGDSNTLPDVYRVEVATGTWELVSVPVTGTTSASVAGTVLQTGSSVYATSPGVVLSADGQEVFFYSARADLVTGDTNASVDLFVKDMTTAAVRRVSTTAAGTNIAKVVTGPALAVTPDGRFAVFPAAASNGPMTVLRKDLVTGELLTVSTVVRAGQSTEFGVFRDAGDLAVSDDGRYVVLSTTQKVLTSTPGASFSTGLAYRKDVQTGEVLALGTGQSGSWEHRVAVDPTGRYGFYSTISADVATDRNFHTDVYRRDLSTGDLVLVTSRSDGSATPTAVNGSVDPKEYGYVVALSGDRVVVTTMQALDAGDVNKVMDTYVRDVGAGLAASTVRAS